MLLDSLLIEMVQLLPRQIVWKPLYLLYLSLDPMRSPQEVLGCSTLPMSLLSFKNLPAGYVLPVSAAPPGAYTEELVFKFPALTESS